jgi:phosphotransferase system  glucose/maltose/N-acetylglucosamine-specific IIC component
MSRGYAVGATPVVKVLLAAAIVVGVAALWGEFLSPKRSVQLPGAARLGIAEQQRVVLFALAVAALAATGHPALAMALGVAYAANMGLIVLWKQG